MGRIELPKWVVSNAESVRRECARYRDMTPGERLDHVRIACRSAARETFSLTDWKARLEWTDRLPESSRRAIARLQAHYRGARTRCP